MPEISSSKPYRIGRSKTGLGLFATQKIKKGTKIIRYFGPLLDSKNKKHDDIDNKYLFEINNRWTIDGSTRKNIARYVNHACRPNAESDVNSRKRKVIIRAIKTIQPGEEINYDYGTDYFKIFLKPIGCKCDHCERSGQRSVPRRAENAAEAEGREESHKKAEKDARKPGRPRRLPRRLTAQSARHGQSQRPCAAPANRPGPRPRGQSRWRACSQERLKEPAKSATRAKRVLEGFLRALYRLSGG